MRVLVIDDEPNNVDLLAFRLEALGCDVATAETPSEGLRLAIDWQPALIVADLKLDNEIESGIALARTLREHPVTSKIPLVIHSVFVSHPSEAPDDLPPAEAFLSKPFRFQELETLIETFRRRRAG